MNKLEELRIDRMKRAGCCACAYLGIVNIGVDVHHLLLGGQRMGDWFTILLCPGHHRGVWTPEQRELMHPSQLIAISDGRKTFCRIYPTERELWELTQERLGLAWPPSKILPRVA